MGRQHGKHPALLSRSNHWLILTIRSANNTRFVFKHSEKIPSAMERYQNEVRRILGVLDGALAGKEWLVGDKCTFADFAFVPWNDSVDTFLLIPPGEDKFAGFPNVKAWHERLTARESWKKAMDLRARLMDEQGLQWNGMPKGINTMEEYEAFMKKQTEK